MNKREIIQKREPNAPRHMKKENKWLLPLTAALLLLSHIGLILLVLWSYRYFGFSKTTFIGIIMILVCLVIIMDIIFLVAFRYRDTALKVITILLAVLLLAGTGVSSYYLRTINQVVDDITENSGTEQYETIGVVFATHEDNKTITDLKDLNNKKVGVLKSFSVDKITASSLGKDHLEKEGVSPVYEEYNSTNDLFLALAGKEVDAAIFQKGYRTQFASEDGYEEYVEKIIDIGEFEEKVQTADNKSANLNLADNPFNILLIGLAPEPGGGGLPDAIILASVNPRTMTVSMVSIARDSYVSIPCYGGAKNKINDTGANRACLMESVSELLDKDIDLYMEVNFKGVVDIVDAIGPIWIDSPVEFVGQDSSSIRGNMVNKIYKGGQWVDGEHALTFARERKRMPNGDFDRQKHQKEVIIEIVKKLLELRDVNKALDVMKIAGDNFSTNLSLKQLTDVFNLLVNATNYNGIPTFDTIDIQQLRITGYPSWFYSYSMRLPLWIYRIYNGSIAETQAKIEDVLGQYDLNTIKQDPNFKFFAEYNYVRGPLYSETFNEQEIHEPMPAFITKLTDMTYAEALSWASANGVTLNVTFIPNDSPDYIASEDGWVMSQSVRYGALVSEYPVVGITVMGQPMSDEDRVPNFVGGRLADAQAWADGNGIALSIVWSQTDDPKLTNTISSQSPSAGSDKRNISTLEVTAYNGPYLVEDLIAGLKITKATNLLESYGFVVQPVYVEDNGRAPGTIIDWSPAGAVYPGQTITLTVTQCSSGYEWNKESKSCEISGGTEPDPEPPTPEHNHEWEETKRTEPTCTESGTITLKCKTCGEKSTQTIDPLGHDYVVIEEVEASCESGNGHKTYQCQRCGDTYTEEFAPEGCE